MMQLWLLVFDDVYFILLRMHSSVEFLKRCRISPGADRKDQERPPEPDGSFQTVVIESGKPSLSQITSMTASQQGEIDGQN